MTTFYKTSDPYFAAFLRVAGVPFHDVEREGGRAYFLFDDQGPALMRDYRRQYFADEAKVPAHSYSQAIRTMKSLVYADG
jgi:hypothetical protein